MRMVPAVSPSHLSNGSRSGNYWIVGDVNNHAGRSLYVRLKGPLSGKARAGNGRMARPENTTATCLISSPRAKVRPARHVRGPAVLRWVAYIPGPTLAASHDVGLANAAWRPAQRRGEAAGGAVREATQRRGDRATEFTSTAVGKLPTWLDARKPSPRPLILQRLSNIAACLICVEENSVATARPKDAFLGTSNETALGSAMLQGNMFLDFFVQRTYSMCL